MRSFHPLSEEFPLMPEKELQDLIEDMKENGFDDRFPIYLYDGMILDGRNRYLACEAAGIDGVYKEFGRNGSIVQARRFVKRANAHRRHLVEEWRQRNREERIERAVTMKEEGKTIREIADIEGVTHTQIQRDLERGRSKKEDNGSVSNPPTPNQNGTSNTNGSGKGSGKGTGGKSGGSSTRTKTKKLLCSKCERLPAPVKDCPSCESVRQKKKDDDKAARVKQKADEKAAADAAKAAALKAMEIKDDEGIVVPERCKPAFDVAKTIGTICRDLDKMLKQIQEIASGPGGRLLRFESIKQQLRDARGTLWANRATHVCPYCQGEIQKKKPCECCKDDGWVSHHIWKQAPGNDKKAERTAAAS